MKYWQWATLILLAFILSLWLNSCATSVTPKVTTVTVYGPGYQRTVQAAAVDSVVINEHTIEKHDWKSCAWITWDDWWEVPNYYPPSSLIRVEVCSLCGFIRIPPASLKEVVENGR